MTEIVEQPIKKIRADLSAQERADLAALIKRCGVAKPKDEDLAALKQAFVGITDLWKIGGDIANANIERIFTEAYGKDPLLNEAGKAAIRSLKSDLGFTTASPLERLLIEEIAFNWLAHSFNENKYGAAVVGSLSLSQGDFWERRMLASQKRYLRGIEALARIRKLARPDPTPVQVNIADKQVNISGAASNN